MEVIRSQKPRMDAETTEGLMAHQAFTYKGQVTHWNCQRHVPQDKLTHEAESGSRETLTKAPRPNPLPS